MRAHRSLLVGAAFVAALGLAACSGAGVTAGGPALAAKPPLAGPAAPGTFAANGSVDASSGQASLQMLDAMKFQPNTLTGVRPGQKVTVELQNTGSVAHDFYAPGLGVTTAVKVDPGRRGTATFTAPAAAGTYQFWCNQPGHAEGGMIGEVVVRA